MKYSKTLSTGLIIAALSSTNVMANTWQGETKDAWLDGKIETAFMLNSELNNFEINTDVENGVAVLSGTVKTEIEKDLAEEITNNIEGVTDVNNNIEVKEDYTSKIEKTGDNFARTWSDLTITAGLNMKFAANDDIAATEIDVDTLNGNVTLTGTVKSKAAHDLAIEIAKGFDNVVDVDDQLTIVSES